MKINSKNMEVKVIKLNYLGNYTHKINDLLKNLDEKKIESLLKNKNSKLTNYIIRKNKEEFPNMDQNDFIKALLLQANLIKEKIRPENIIKIKMDKKGKFISDTFYTKYNWMLDVYFDDKLQDLDINETNDEIPEQITIKINYPLYDIESMFYDCDCIKEIKFVKFNMTHITSLKSLFSECRSLTKVNVEIFETKNVTDMSSLFYNCYSLTKLNLSNFKLDNVKDMSAMFYMCMNLIELNFKLTEQNAKKLEDISCIFLGCHSIQKYDLLALDITKIKFKDHYI
jgi:surface protein